MHCFYDCVGAVAFRFGCQAIDERAGEQAAERRDYWYEPQSVRADRFAQHAAFFGKSWRAIAGDPGEKEMLGEAQHPHEELRAEAANDAE